MSRAQSNYYCSENSFFTCNGCSEKVKERIKQTLLTQEAETRTEDENNITIEAITEIGMKHCEKLHSKQCVYFRILHPMLKGCFMSAQRNNK